MTGGGGVVVVGTLTKIEVDRLPCCCCCLHIKNRSDLYFTVKKSVDCNVMIGVTFVCYVLLWSVDQLTVDGLDLLVVSQEI